MDDWTPRAPGMFDPARRGFLAAGAGLVAAPLVDAAAAQSSARPAEAPGAPAARKRPANGRSPNILFIFSDQERYLDRWPTGLALPGHERLARTGTTFQRHYTSATMCTSSRSVLM